MLIQNHLAPTFTQRTSGPQAQTDAVVGAGEEPASSPTDGVSLSDIQTKEAALEAEYKEITKQGKIGAIAGGAVGATVGIAAGALGGVIGAVAGLAAAPAGAAVGLAVGGVGGFLLATHNRDGAPALIGGLLLGALGGVVGGYAGFAAGAALGSVAGAAGGLLGATAGGLGLGTVGAAVGGLGKMSAELIANQEKYPLMIEKFREEEAAEQAKKAQQ